MPMEGGYRDSEGAITEVAVALDGIEQRLLALIRAGAHAATPLEDVVEGLAQLAPEARDQYQRLLEILERRDLEYELTSQVEELRRRLLWLYRKARLEYLFFAKLRFERASRDALYKQVLELFEELSGLEAAERRMRRLSDDDLSAELLGEFGPTST